MRKSYDFVEILSTFIRKLKRKLILAFLCARDKFSCLSCEFKSHKIIKIFTNHFQVLSFFTKKRICCKFNYFEKKYENVSLDRCHAFDNPE